MLPEKKLREDPRLRRVSVKVVKIFVSRRIPKRKPASKIERREERATPRMDFQTPIRLGSLGISSFSIYRRGRVYVVF